LNLLTHSAAIAAFALLPLVASAEDISTHVLDISSGTGAAGVPVTLERQGEDGWTMLGEAMTADNGRVEGFAIDVESGEYRLNFDLSEYDGFDGREATFFPHIVVDFQVRDTERHHHVPVVVSGFGYSTYLGN